jgi:hypothetical protein
MKLIQLEQDKNQKEPSFLPCGNGLRLESIGEATDITSMT